MKLTHISLAILTAIALTACGNDNNSTGNSAGQNDINKRLEELQKKQAENDAKAKENEEKNKELEAALKKLSSSKSDTQIGDAKGNLDNIATSVKDDNWSDASSVSGQQYIRNSSSKFADQQNPVIDDKNASATVLTSLEVTDPGLGNFVVAQEGSTPFKGKTVKVLSYLGKYDKHLNSGSPYDEIQKTNEKYVLVGNTTYNEAKTSFEDLTSGDHKTNGLVAISRYASGEVVGTEEKNASKSRFFGSSYKTYNANPVEDNTYVGIEQSATADAGKYHLVAKVGKLEKVQYGRISANLEIDSATTSAVAEVNGKYVRHFDFAAKNDPKAVSFYFYRGKDETKVDDMKKLDGTLSYKGHALTYGVVHGDKNDLGGFPTAFGSTSSEGLGSFVDAQYNVKDQKISGTVYDVFIKDNTQPKQKLQKDTLIRFSGNVFGNTSKGSATLLAAHSQDQKEKTGDFRGSFYGVGATELGGAINSVTSDDKYGSSKDAWGVVFGAKKVSSAEWLAEFK